MAINDKLNRIKEIKEDIKQALIDKGVEVTDEDSFGSYADKITNIPMEGGDPYYEELYNLRTGNGTNMDGLFAYMTGDSLDLTGIDVSQCTSMRYMFDNCSVNNVDITGWDLSKVNDVTNMFQYTYLENYKGLSNIVLPASLAYMLSSARIKQSKLDLSTWDTSNVTNLNSFYSIDDCEILDLSNWNTANVTSMTSVFSLGYSNKLKELIIPTWDMTNTTSYNNLFGYSSNLIRIKVIDLSKSNDITITKILQSLPARTQTSYSDILVPVDTSQEVIDALIAKYWRPIGPSFNIESFQIISELDELLPGQKTKIICHSQIPWYSSIPEVEFISSDETIATVNENGEVSTYSLGNVEIYARLKNNPEVISNTISINITETDSTPYVIKFKGTSTPDYSNQLSINGNSVQLSSISFDAITGIYTYDVGQEITNIKFNVSGSTDYANTITELVKFDFNGNNITNMDGMFMYCSQLTHFDFSEWDTSNVTSMKNLFRESGFTDLSSVENWDVSNIEDYAGVFWKSNIETIDLSKWTVTNENLVNIGNMFNGCRSLKSVKMFSAKIIASYTFTGCTQLEVVDLTGATNGSSSSSIYSGMFTDVPSTCQIYVGPNWTLTESECSFTGTFIRVNPEYYTEYSIDSTTATFNMRSIDSINSGAYLPELSNGYDGVLLTLNDGSITTDLNTEANQVSSIKIYYPEETSYVKFANTKVKEVNHLSGSNITDCTGMFTNCVYLEKADLTSLDSTKVTVDTTMFEGVSPEAEVTFNDSWDIPESDMGIEEQVKYITVTVYYNREDQNYDNIQLSFLSIEEFDASATGFYDEDNNGRYATWSCQKGKPYRLTVFDNGSESELASGEFTFTEDTNLWLVEGESTFRTEKPGTEETPEEVSPILISIATNNEPSGGDIPDTYSCTLHYRDEDGNYDITSLNFMDENKEIDSEDDFGKIWVLEVITDLEYSIMITQGTTEFLNTTYTFTEDTELWVIKGDSTIYTQEPETDEPEEPGTGNGSDKDIIAYKCDMCGKNYMAHEAILNHMICSSCGGTLLPSADKNQTTHHH